MAGAAPGQSWAGPGPDSQDRCSGRGEERAGPGQSPKVLSKGLWSREWGSAWVLSAPCPHLFASLSALRAVCCVTAGGALPSVALLLACPCLTYKLLLMPIFSFLP